MTTRKYSDYHRILSTEDVTRLMRAVDVEPNSHNTRAMIAIQSARGLRPVEIAHLRYATITDEN